MSMTEIEAIAWERCDRPAGYGESGRIRFVTGDIPLMRLQGMRIERLAEPTRSNPYGLWVVR
jgi:hypothetical protein